MKENAIMNFPLVIFLIFVTYVHSDRIDVSYCEPPDFPENGGYGPLEDSYTPGDTVHYFCNTSYFMGGNYLRVCLDNGDWGHDTPVCDPPADFEDVDQTSTAEPDYRNEAYEAIDGYKYSCSSTEAGPNQEWTATFKEVSQVIRVMVFLPKEEVAYEVFIVREGGSEISCGGQRLKYKMPRLEWTIHNCLEPHNTGVVGLKIKSTDSSVPLRLCEVVAHILTNPTCNDPRVPVESGRLMISRKKAQLICSPGYAKGPNHVIKCMRTGVWEKKALYCTDTGIELESIAADPCRPSSGGNESPVRGYN